MATGSRYAGKVVIVTGGGRGIGAGILPAFVESGALVVICDKEAEVGGPGPGAGASWNFLLSDVTQEEDMRTLISETVRCFDHLDCVVNNAGYPCPPPPAEELGNVINTSSLVGAIGQSQAVPKVTTKERIEIYEGPARPFFSY